MVQENGANPRREAPWMDDVDLEILRRCLPGDRQFDLRAAGVL
jgi:hypothetical protein